MPKKRKRAAAERGEGNRREGASKEGESEPTLHEEMTTEYLSLLESMNSTGQSESGAAEDNNSGEEKTEEEEENSSDQDDKKGSRKRPGKAKKSSAEPPKKKSPFENAFLSFIDERGKSPSNVVFGEPNRPRRGQGAPSKPQTSKENSLKAIRIQGSASDQLDSETTDQSGASTSKDQLRASTSKDQSRARNGRGGGGQSGKSTRGSQPEGSSEDESSDIDETANGKSIFESVDLEEEEEEKIDLRPRRMSSRQAAQKARMVLRDHDSEDSDSDGLDPIERQKESSVLKASADSTGTTETKADGAGLLGRGRQVTRKRRAKRRHSDVDEDDDNDPEWNPIQEKAPPNRLMDMSTKNSGGNSLTLSSSDDEISDDADMRRGAGRPPAIAPRPANTTTSSNNDKKRPMQPPKVVIYPNKVVKTAASSSASGQRYTTTTHKSGGQAPTSSNVVSSSVGSSTDMMSDEPLIISDAESESEEDSRMNYLREEFVVNTEHLSDEKHPIWQIQKTLLKKYVPYQDKKHWYIASNSYLGWFGSEKSKFRPVRCRFVRKERNADIVKVVKPRRSANNASSAEAAPDTTNEQVQTSQQSLADSFKVYLQAMVSQVLDDEFLPCVEEERDEFFLTALGSLDERLEGAKRAVADSLSWLGRFKTLAETWPFLREEEGEPATGVLCQACEKQGHVAAKLLRLDGRPYDRLTLQDKEAPSASEEQEQLLKLGRVCGERVSLYHRLHHYRFQLYRRCMAKVATLQEEHPELPQEEVVRQILKNIAWVKQLYEELRSLLEECQAIVS
ncbi:glutamine and serine-rich protein 1-like isoform X6 [Branchiostoma lanceolatum]|uniref:glutamine and serine-rich protein 1-like isoform X3 n=1 Tax=Branchiostoma lanceolatum TaxID=7740 RepID=UPI00345558F2